MQKPAIDRVDIAIIGGGVAGCYSGYRLTGSEGSFNQRSLPESIRGKLSARVALFEQSDTIGGRLQSVLCSGRFAELGGMRFSEHTPLLTDLLRHLDLSRHAVDFEMDQQGSSRYLPGKQHRKAGIVQSPTLCSSGIDYAARNAEDLVGASIARCFPDFSVLHQRYHASLANRQYEQAQNEHAQYERSKLSLRINGQPFTSLSWHQFLCKMLPLEAVNFLEQVGGYEIRFSNGSAACWLDNIFFNSVSEVFKCLSSGFASLPRLLHTRFSGQGGITRLMHRLIDFSKTGNSYHLRFDSCGNIKTVEAGMVILTLPKPALEQFDQDNFFFQQIDKPKFNSIRSVDAFKLFLTYPYAWWEKLGLLAGRSTTDLPLRQCYYYRQQGDTGPAMIMAAYCNGPDTTYWQRVMDACRKSDASPAEQEEAIHEILKKTAHEMLLDAHQTMDAPNPLQAFYRHWNQSEGQAGWHVWEPGALPQDVISYMRRPVSGEHIFLAGEGWSWLPGSVAGALLSAEAMLEQEVGMKRPHWITYKLPF